MKLLNHQGKVFGIIAIIAIAIVFLGNRMGSNPLKIFSYELFRYPQNFLSSIGFGTNNVFKFLFEIKDLHNDKDALVEENNQLKKEVFELKEVKYENDLLRSALNLPAAKKRNLIDAAVIGKDPYSFSSFLIISRGSESGIKAGMTVVDSSGFFIGKISDAGHGTSKVSTVEDTVTSFSAIDEESRVQGLVKRELDSGLIFDMVLQDEKIETGDVIIIAPSSADFMPQPVAKVISVEKFPNKTFQNIKLLPLADIKNTEKVFVILE